MGLLDDAIRQHLELKRRHGADPGELARLEQEAFGPVGRPEALRPPAAGTSVAHEEELSFQESVADAAADPAWDDLPAAGGEGEAPEDHRAGRFADERDEDAYEFEDEYEDAPADVADAPRRRAEPIADVGQPTAEFSVDDLHEADTAFEPPAPREPAPPRDVVAADEEPADHDELEETPEFLQETPEHDRLWFEQKPPKDFDF